MSWYNTIVGPEEFRHCVSCKLLLSGRHSVEIACGYRLCMSCAEETIFSPLLQVWRLGDGTKPKQGRKERECEILKKTLHLLKREFGELQELKCEYARQRNRLSIWALAASESLEEFQLEINRQLEEIEFQQQEFEFLFRIAYFSSLLEWLLTLYAVEDAHQGGGFRNIFLDSWWLEFWEIILLAAGDVERNPGPKQITEEELAEVSDTPIEEDDLSLVFDALLPVSAKWSRLCCSLGLRASLLDTIEKNHPRDVDDCLFEGLKHWVLRNFDTTKHGLPTWRNLVAAVDDSSGGHNHALASEIATQHKQPDLLPPKEGSVTASSTAIPGAAVCSDSKKSQAKSTAFANMYRGIILLFPRSVKASEVKDFLRCFCHPQSPRQLYVDPRVYEGARSTKDILKKLCPEYINPAELFVLEGIVETFGSRQCKKLLQDFQDKFY